MVRLSSLMEDNPVVRLDSTYFLRADLTALEELRARDHATLGKLAYVTDGIHTSIPFQKGSGIKVLSAKHPKDGYIEDAFFEEIAPEAHSANPRTALRDRDVLISTVGTIGNAAVVPPSLLPANSDRHIGIVRPITSVDRPIRPEFLTAALLSRFGRFQSRRETTGNVQPNLFLDKVRSLIIPRFSKPFEEVVSTLYVEAGDARSAAKTALAQAESDLLDALGLHGWSPPEPLTYTRSAADVFAAERLDAQYYQPAKYEMLSRLGAMPSAPLHASFDVVRDLVNPRRTPDARCRNYDLTDALQPLLDGSKELVTFADMESQKVRFRDGDLAVARLRSYLREIAVVRVEDDVPAVGSSEFYVLRAKPDTAAPSAETLMTYLRAAPVQVILKWCQDGSQHPRFSERDLMAIPLPDAVTAFDSGIKAQVEHAFAERARSARLFAAAKRAVEVAIEQDEMAALAFVKGEEAVAAAA